MDEVSFILRVNVLPILTAIAQGLVVQAHHLAVETNNCCGSFENDF